MVINGTLDQSNLIDIYRTFHPKAAEYILFACAHGMLTRIDHMLGHKICFNRFKRIQIISSIFSDHSGMKLEINHRKKNRKKTHNHMETKQYVI